jgi:hypothetical protein
MITRIEWTGTLDEAEMFTARLMHSCYCCKLAASD